MHSPDDTLRGRRAVSFGIAGLATGYAALAAIGLGFALLSTGVSPYWPAAGLALAALWRWGWRLWPGVFIGSLAASLFISHSPVLVATAAAIGSTLAALAGAGLLRRLGADPDLPRPSDPILLLVVAAASTLIAALIGSSTVIAVGLADDTPWHQVLWTWWTGDYTGVASTTAVFTTVLLPPGRRRELLAALAAIAAATALSDWLSPVSQTGLSPWAFLLFPPILWAAVRLGSGGAALCVAYTALGTAALTVSGHGPFADFSDGNRTHLPFQIFTIATAATALVIAAYARAQLTTSAALRASEERYRLVANNSSDLVCLHTLDGRYQWVSPSATGLIGWSPEQLVGIDPYSLFHPDDIERIRSESHAMLLDSHKPTTISYRLRRADGSYIWLETVNRLASDATGRPIAIQTSSRDISQRKLDEQHLAELQRAAAMAERMASIGTLAGGVAHEFNNLNAVVMGNVEMALRRPDLPADARRRLDHVRDAVDREKGIVEALLAFSRSERGPTEVVDAGRVVSTTLALARRTLRQRQVSIETDLPTEPVFATIPSGSLGQVLLNLLLNACDATDRRDDPRIWVSLRRKGGRGIMTVRDNGIGIDPALSTRIFEPFFSTKGEHASDGQGQPWLRGSGLGLSVCQTLVGQMHGHLEVQSVPEQGSTFTVSIPLSDAPRPIAVAELGNDAPCARVLVVDDEPEIRRLLCEHLIAAGHVAVEAKDGHQALNHLGHEEIDLVLLNWNMPGLDGQGVLEHMELHPERRWPPVVVVSGWTGGGSGIDRWRHEIAGQLRKPFSLEQVRSSVERALLGQRDLQRDDESSAG